MCAPVEAPLTLLHALERTKKMTYVDQPVLEAAAISLLGHFPAKNHALYREIIIQFTSAKASNRRFSRRTGGWLGLWHLLDLQGLAFLAPYSLRCKGTSYARRRQCQVLSGTSRSRVGISELRDRMAPVQFDRELDLWAIIVELRVNAGSDPANWVLEGSVNMGRRLGIWRVGTMPERCPNNPHRTSWNRAEPNRRTSGE